MKRVGGCVRARARARLLLQTTKYSITNLYTHATFVMHAHTHACTRRFITGGINAGIMKHVGEARAKYNPSAPLIGITMLPGIEGGVQLRQMFRKAKIEEIQKLDREVLKRSPALKEILERCATVKEDYQGSSFVSRFLRNIRCISKQAIDFPCFSYNNWSMRVLTAYIPPGSKGANVGDECKKAAVKDLKLPIYQHPHNHRKFLQDLSGAWIELKTPENSELVEDSEMCYEDCKDMSDKKDEKADALDSNHSHFILLDDGVTHVSGLKWKEAGPENPSMGTEIKNELLAAALQKKVDFNQEEWENFVEFNKEEWEKVQVADLYSNSYIKVGNRYFKPAVSAKEAFVSGMDRSFRAAFETCVARSTHGRHPIYQLHNLPDKEDLEKKMHKEDLTMEMPILHWIFYVETIFNKEKEKEKEKEIISKYVTKESNGHRVLSVKVASARSALQAIYMKYHGWVVDEEAVKKQTCNTQGKYWCESKEMAERTWDEKTGSYGKIPDGSVCSALQSIWLHAGTGSAIQRLAEAWQRSAQQVNKKIKEEREDKEGGDEGGDGGAVLRASLTLGLKWKEAGYQKPSTGTEIKNELLAAALQRKVEFQKEELEKFQVANLSSDSYIKVGHRYFKPIALLNGREISKEEFEKLCESAVQRHKENFQVADLSGDSYIKAGDRYFKPAVSSKEAFVADLSSDSYIYAGDRYLKPAESAKEVFAVTHFSGLKWKEAGSEKPSTGTEINNERLAEALQKKVEFNKAEWDKFQVADLSSDSYIYAGDRYFKPAVSAKGAFAVTHSGLKWKEAGSEKPSTGTEIKNERLAEALQKKVEFNKEEWDDFQVADLSSDSYIYASDRYFKPAVYHYAGDRYLKPAVSAKEVFAVTHLSGLKWREAGSEKPSTGTEINNERLAEALQKKVEALQRKFEFNKAEWDQVADLSSDSYIYASDRYFKPFALLNLRNKSSRTTDTLEAQGCFKPIVAPLNGRNISAPRTTDAAEARCTTKNERYVVFECVCLCECVYMCA